MMTFRELEAIGKEAIGEGWFRVFCLAAGVSRRTEQRWALRLAEAPDDPVPMRPGWEADLAEQLDGLAGEVQAFGRAIRSRVPPTPAPPCDAA